MKQNRPTTRRYVIKSPETFALLAELSPCGDGADPAQVIGWSRNGNWTRVRASYPNGWVLVVNFDRAGSISSHTAKFSFHTVIQGKKQDDA